MKAIVYKTNTGSTAEYALLLAQRTGLPAYEFADAKKNLPAGTEILYLGWVMASCVQGYKDAAKRFEIGAVCAVGLLPGSAQTEKTVREHTGVSESVPLFPLQGNFDLEKLRGIYRFVMQMLIHSLAKKEARTPDEEKMLCAMRSGAVYVDVNNLQAVFDWYENRGK